MKILCGFILRERDEPMRGVILALAFLLMLAAPRPLAAHELERRITRGDAVVVELFHPDHAPFSYEAYEIYRAGEETPFQTGRSDARGRIVFLPDRAGSWRLRTFSEDGHGADFTFEAGGEVTSEVAAPAGAAAPGHAAEPGRSGVSGGGAFGSWNRLQRIVFGVSIIFGMFGVISLLVRRSRA